MNPLADPLMIAAMAKGKNDDKDPKKSAKSDGDAKAGDAPKAAKADDDKAKAKADDDKARAKADDDKAGAKADDDKAKAKADDDKAKAKADDDKAKAKADDDAKAKAKADEPPAVPPRPAPPIAPPNGDSKRFRLLPPKAIDTSVAPSTPAPAPLPAPRGDARSLRRGEDFCVIYRFKNHLIRRQGKVGTTGQYTVTEYPSMAAAAHAYAQECSELTGDGFTDIR